MDYEELYSRLQEGEKQLKDRLAAMQRISKAVAKETEAGDLKSLIRDLNTLAEEAGKQSAVLQELKDQAEQFDAKAYFENGDFAEQMLACCKEMGVDVQGTYPVYEMFPYRVRIDTENQDLYLDRKKVACMRPGSFVQMVKAGQERLMKANFNAQSFANELADAYDLALMRAKKPSDADMSLMTLYKYLAPMSRFRKDYDQQSFAFDLARLYEYQGSLTTRNGRLFQFGPGRNNGKALRILDRAGNEQFLALIRFYEA